VKTVLIVAADFSPTSLPSALRPRLFAQHLPAFGWRPLVLTTDPRHYESSSDPENDQFLPEDLEIVRTPALPIQALRRIGIGDIGMRSLWHYWLALSRLCRTRRIDALLITVPPHVTSVLGPLARRRFGVPYVVDYQDPWISNYYWKLPSSQRPGGYKWALAHALARCLEPVALSSVSHITAVSQGTIEQAAGRYPWLKKVATTEIPFGGEAGDFAYLRAHPRRNPIFDPDDGRTHITYTGVCPPPMHETVRALLGAVRLGRQEDACLFKDLRLHFVGTTYAAHGNRAYQVMPLARELGLADIVDEHPARVPYLDALQIMLDSHALLLIGSEEAHYTASKVFPYILAQRPLLALVHQASSVVDILRETGAGEILRYDSSHPVGQQVGAIKDGLAHLLNFHTADPPATRWDAFERFTARAMAGRLGSVLDQTI
jgi:hypothetical protein